MLSIKWVRAWVYDIPSIQTTSKFRSEALQPGSMFWGCSLGFRVYLGVA